MPTGINVRNKYPVNWTHSRHESVFVNGIQKNKLPPLQILNWLFRYCPESGKLFRIRESNGKVCVPEREITYVNSKGYLSVSLRDSNGLEKLFLVHQIIYFMVSGIEPLSIVDHMDGNPLNNRFSNLRLTTESGNQHNKRMNRNNTSGFVGVTLVKGASKWKAHVKIDGSNKHIGLFDSSEEANQARLEYVGRWNLHNLDEAFSYRHTNGD